MEPDHLTTYWEKEKDENSKKGAIASVCFHSILLLILLLPWFKTQDPPPGPQGVLISLGNPAMLDDAEPSPAQSAQSLAYQNEDEPPEPAEEKVVEEPQEPEKTISEIKPKEQQKPNEAPKPVKEVPAKFEKTVQSTQDESPVAIKEDKEKKQKEELNRKAQEEQKAKEAVAKKRAEEELEAKRIADANKRAAAEAKQKQQEAERQRQREAAAKKQREEEQRKQEAYERTKSELGGLFNGNGESQDSEGKKGDPEGSSDSEILEGLSGGLGEVGGGLSGRGIVFEPTIKENSQKTGRVVVKVCVDKSGSVISSKFTQRGSTTTDSELVDVAQKAAAKYKFTPGDLSEQCGTITINFSLK